MGFLWVFFCLIGWVFLLLTDCNAIVHKGCKESFASCAKVKMKVRDFNYSTEQTKTFKRFSMQIYNIFYRTTRSFQFF